MQPNIVILEQTDHTEAAQVVQQTPQQSANNS